MLYSKNWKIRKKGFYTIDLILYLCAFVFIGCIHCKTPESLSQNDKLFEYNDIDQINNYLKNLVSEDKDTLIGDSKLRNYYSNGGDLLWINENGLINAADTLLFELSKVEDYGFNLDVFLVDTIKSSMSIIRNKDFTVETDTLLMLASIEYNLTKSYLRYVAGMTFGYFNPYKVLNRKDKDKLRSKNGIIKYRQLFDIEVDQPSNDFYQLAINSVSFDKIGAFMRNSHPKTPVYNKLIDLLSDTTLTEEQKLSVVCNMERCRWKGANPDYSLEKYVVVNIPAFHLYAIDKDSILDMKIGCGTLKNKTPLLTGMIKWMEVNPVWIIPKSIIENEVAIHAGDTSYFLRNRYDIINKETYDTLNAEEVTADMLKSGDYRVIQQSGPGNSLGRLVFRFPNNLSIYLHDTSSPAFFKRERRAVSHGCVRIQRPFDFACFLIDKPDEWLMDRIRISIDMKPKTDRGKKYLEENIDAEEHRLIKRVNFEKEVPLHIVYYTIYIDENNELVYYPDVYGYDKIILNYIKPFIGIAV